MTTYSLRALAHVDEAAQAVWRDYCEENQISSARSHIRTHRYRWSKHTLGEGQYMRSRTPEGHIGTHNWAGRSASGKSRRSWSILPVDFAFHPWHGTIAFYVPYIPLQVTHLYQHEMAMQRPGVNVRTP